LLFIVNLSVMRLNARPVNSGVGLLRVTSIIHISDPHFETWETMPRLNNLAHSHPEIDVVAVTGDCTSLGNKRLPADWNQWPQHLKLSVPGNHDLDDTFDLLDDWIHCAPWVTRVNGLVFVGLDTSMSFLGIQYQLDRLRSRATGGDAVVMLSHRWPSLSIDERFIGNTLTKFVGNRPLLVLHGHEHPYPFERLWEEHAKMGSLTCYRSKVSSSARNTRGLAHIVTWENQQFSCSVVQGDL
jgi:3',5'-cyclic AMP phosphodiesterase CpdA